MNLRRSSSLPGGYLVDKRTRDAEASANLFKRGAGFTHLKQQRNFSICEFCKWMTLAFWNPAPRCVLPTRVFCQGNPLQIFRSIVKPVAVQVVNSGAIKVAGHEGFGNKPMHESLVLDAINHSANYEVFSGLHQRGDDAAFCDFAKAAHRWPIKATYAAMTRRLKKWLVRNWFPVFNLRHVQIVTR